MSPLYFLINYSKPFQKGDVEIRLMLNKTKIAAGSIKLKWRLLPQTYETDNFCWRKTKYVALHIKLNELVHFKLRVSNEPNDNNHQVAMANYTIDCHSSLGRGTSLYILSRILHCCFGTAQKITQLSI